MSPQFLTLDEVMDLHCDQIKRYGGTLGVRDVTLLESAIAAPQSWFGDQYLHGDRFEMASAYLFHVVQNYPFLDGNKCVGTAAALTLLELNGVETKIPTQVLVAMVLAVAQGGQKSPPSRHFSTSTLNHSRDRHHLRAAPAVPRTGLDRHRAVLSGNIGKRDGMA